MLVAENGVRLLMACLAVREHVRLSGETRLATEVCACKSGSSVKVAEVVAKEAINQIDEEFFPCVAD